MLWRSTLRSDFAVVLALGSRRELAALTSFVTLKQARRVSFWTRAARADPRDCAPRRHRNRPPQAPAGSACRAATVLDSSADSTRDTPRSGSHPRPILKRHCACGYSSRSALARGRFRARSSARRGLRYITRRAGEVLTAQLQRIALVEQRRLNGQCFSAGCAVCARKRTHPIHALGLEHLLDARRGQHAAICSSLK